MLSTNSSDESLFVSDDSGSAATAWASLVRYIRRRCASDYLVADVSILVKRRTPVAWRVLVRPTDPFYDEGEGGDTEKQWRAFSHHLLAHCEGNEGFGIVETGLVLIHRERPLAWLKPTLTLMHPLSLARLEGAGEAIAKRVYSEHLPAI